MRRCERCRTPLVFLGIGRPRLYCDSCNHLISLEKSLKYRLNNRELIRLRNQRFRLLYPDKVKESYLKNYAKMSALKKKVEDKVFDDVLKHPRKWLNKVEK